MFDGIRVLCMQLEKLCSTGEWCILLRFPRIMQIPGVFRFVTAMQRVANNQSAIVVCRHGRVNGSLLERTVVKIYIFLQDLTTANGWLRLRWSSCISFSLYFLIELNQRHCDYTAVAHKPTSRLGQKSDDTIKHDARYSTAGKVDGQAPHLTDVVLIEHAQLHLQVRTTEITKFIITDILINMMDKTVLLSQLYINQWSAR